MTAAQQPGTPSTGSDVVIGPPGFARGYSAVFAVVWVVALGTFFVQAARDGATPVMIVAPLMLVAGLLITYRNARLGFRTDGDVLTVRGPWSTQRLRRDEIAEIRRGEQTAPFRTPAVVLTTRDGGMVIGPPTTLLPFGGNARARIDDHVGRLTAWLGR